MDSKGISTISSLNAFCIRKLLIKSYKIILPLKFF
jgi:hypothetical protein